MIGSAVTCAHGFVCQHHGPLPFTGTNLTIVLLAAAALIALGTALYFMSRG